MALSVLLILIPFLFGLFCLLFQANISKWIALGAGLFQLGLTLSVLLQFDPAGGVQFEFQQAWISSLGVQFHIGIDGTAAILLLLTNFLLPLIVLSSWSGRAYSSKSHFFALVLCMQAALNGVFMTYDCFVFYLFWELALIPVFFISLIWGGELRSQIIYKFFIYTLFGSLFMLLGIIYLYIHTPYPHSFDLSALSQVELSCFEESFVFGAFFLAFAIKMPLFPFHTWQPETYAVSPTPATMLLSGIMLKMGIFGILRWIIPIMPNAFNYYAYPILICSVIGIVYASIIAIKQSDVKKLVAYSSIAHVGLISAGLFSGTLEGMQGSIIQMLNHGINVVGLFFILEIIHQRTEERDIKNLGGLIHQMPILSVFFVINILGTVALPLTNGFVGEFLLLYGVFQYDIVLGAFAGLTIILGAVYLLRMYKNVMLGEVNPTFAHVQDISMREGIVLSVLTLAIFAIGIYPKALLAISEPSAKLLVDLLGQSCGN